MQTRIIFALTSVFILAITATAAFAQTPAKDGGTRPIIKERPEPTWPSSIRKAGEFSIVLHSLFRADGTITDITRYRLIPERLEGFSPDEIDSLTACAIEAAVKIKFLPATRNGHAVSVWMELQYDFKLTGDGTPARESDEYQNARSVAKSSTATDRPLVLQYTPDPILPVDLDLKIELAVTLKAEFKQDGKMGTIEVISSRVPASMSAKMLTRLEQATKEAAGRIRFAPAVKDGHRVSQWYLLEYTFRRDGQKRYSNWRRDLIA